MFRPKISNEDLQRLCDEMDQAERSGMFDGLFSGQYQKQNNVTVILTDLPTKKKLLVAISPNMRLTMDFFKRIYGYELSYTGFAEIAIGRLTAAGCSKAPEYYQRFVSEFEDKQKEKLQKVSNECRKKVEYEGEKNNKKQEGGDKWGLKSSQKKKYSLEQKNCLLKKLQQRAVSM